MTKKKTPTTTDAKPITPTTVLTTSQRTAKFAEIAQGIADLLNCASGLQAGERYARADALIAQTLPSIRALVAEYVDTAPGIFTGPPKAPSARSHKRKVDVGAPAID